MKEGTHPEFRHESAVIVDDLHAPSDLGEDLFVRQVRVVLVAPAAERSEREDERTRRDDGRKRGVAEVSRDLGRECARRTCERKGDRPRR